MIELYIETLTGVLMELMAYPYETVYNIKSKIYKLEGIPISEQHLVWQSIELENEQSLQHYRIPDGATLRLVLNMRGGPVNTRRVPLEESSLREMAEYFSEPILDDRSPGDRPVTVIVYQQGEHINFFRLVDRDAASSLSYSLSGGSDYNGEVDSPIPKERQEENERTRDKMKVLKEQMENLTLAKEKRLVKRFHLPRPPSSGRPKSRTKLRLVSTTTTTANRRTGGTTTLNKNGCLPPLGQTSTTTTSDDSTSRATEDAQTLQDEKVTSSAAVVVATSSPAIHPVRPPPPVSSTQPQQLQSLQKHPFALPSPRSWMLKQSGSSQPPPPVQGESGSAIPSGMLLGDYRKAAKPDCDTSTGDALPSAAVDGSPSAAADGLPPTANRPPSSKVVVSDVGAKTLNDESLVVGGAGHRRKNATSEKAETTSGTGAGHPASNVDTVGRQDPPATATPPSSDRQTPSLTDGLPIGKQEKGSSSSASRQRRGSTSRQTKTSMSFLPHPPPPHSSSSQRLPFSPPSSSDAPPPSEGDGGRGVLQPSSVFSSYLTSPATRRSGPEKKSVSVTLQSLNHQEARAVSGMLRDIVRSANRSRAGYLVAGGKLGQLPKASSSADVPPLNDTNSSILRVLSGGSRDGRATPVRVRLPSVKVTKRRSNKRCAVCHKRTKLATGFQCRCGQNFCLTHLCAEAHSCTYDYKAEGRKLIEQSNPVVNAPKLPKI